MKCDGKVEERHMKEIEEVSEIFCKVTGIKRYSYGFTVSYKDGSFRNIIYNSSESDDKSLQAELRKKREGFIGMLLKSQSENLK